MRIRVKGGGHTAQIYAIRQSIAKALVAFYQKYVDEQSKKEIKDILVRYDRTLLVADPRRCEPKKFGGRGARARRRFNGHAVQSPDNGGGDWGGVQIGRSRADRMGVQLAVCSTVGLGLAGCCH
ncbi:hypothetical protein Ancab_013390 [Ancistrocladus abbreviatus]